MITAHHQKLMDDIDARIKQGGRVVVTIDGMAAAGKSTFAAYLQEHYTVDVCNVIPIDDFFLRPEQRAPQRFAEPGGNIDYERFADEVAWLLMTGEAFSYRPYDCSVQQLAEPINIPPRQLTIVEGVYSYRCMCDISDINVFMRVDVDTQRDRLQTRGERLYERFIKEWLPMEHLYFEHFGVLAKCDYVLENA